MEVFKMNPEVKALWLEALRSGEYKQTDSVLRDETGFCCLGVLCDLHTKATGNGGWEDFDLYYAKGESYSELPPPTVVEWAGLVEQNPEVVIQVEDEFDDYQLKDVQIGVAELNDGGHTFAQIADIIEEVL